MLRRGALPGLTSTREYRHPKGVVGNISPWNYPLTLAVTDALPAFMAGNAVVLKPDRQTSFTALLAAELLDEAGLPRDLFVVVTGEGWETGPALIGEVDYIAFTGSTATGRTVARQAGERLTGCSLELGGKNAMIVLGDADLERAVKGTVRGCFSNAGQLCLSIERLFVQDSICDHFAKRFAQRTRNLKLGSALDYTVDVGSLISQRQLDTVSEHLPDAVEKGATVLAGGRPRPDLGPLFYEPTVLTDVRAGMTLFADECTRGALRPRPDRRLEGARKNPRPPVTRFRGITGDSFTAVTGRSLIPLYKPNSRGRCCYLFIAVCGGLVY